MKLLLFFLSPLFCFGQTIYTGNIINGRSEEKIPFASVALLKENRGTNADENGRFSLAINKFDQDTMIISCVGFETLKVPTSDIIPNRTYVLQERQSFFPEVIVKRNRMVPVTLNAFSSWWCGFNFYTTSDYINQVAQHFHSSMKGSLLSSVDICTSGDKAIFRVRVYDMDPISMQPSAELTDSIIEVHANRKHIHIDLEGYNLYVPEDFFIAIEWLKIKSNEYSAAFRYNGKKTTSTRYYPLVSSKYREKITNSLNEDGVWMLTYQKKWIQQRSHKLLISTTVKN